MKNKRIQTIKELLLELGDDQIVFWRKFCNEVKDISDENEQELLDKWNTFFKENKASIDKLINVRKNMNALEEYFMFGGESENDK